jgi:hypothetical protein
MPAEARLWTGGVMGSAATSQSRTHHRPWHPLGHSVQNLARRIAVDMPVMLEPKVGRGPRRHRAGKGGAPCLAQLGASWSDLCSEMRPHAFGNHEGAWAGPKPKNALVRGTSSATRGSPCAEPVSSLCAVPYSLPALPSRAIIGRGQPRAKPDASTNGLIGRYHKRRAQHQPLLMAPPPGMQA